MQLPENWFELDLADEDVSSFKNWPYKVPPQKCKITGTPRFGREVKNGEFIIKFKIDDWHIINKETGEIIAHLDEIESGDR